MTPEAKAREIVKEMVEIYDWTIEEWRHAEEIIAAALEAAEQSGLARGLNECAAQAAAYEAATWEGCKKYLAAKELEMREMREECSELVAALEFYASEQAWYHQTDKTTGSVIARSVEYFDTESSGCVDDKGNNFLFVIGGKRAREALAKYRAKVGTP